MVAYLTFVGLSAIVEKIPFFPTFDFHVKIYYWDED